MVANPELLGEPVSHVWVDTCCIDKTSSAELSEAINSMFRWYREAVCCFALLEDVEASAEADGGVGEEFEASRWFTRGWTLQELLAPRVVHFFDRQWDWIGSKESLVQRISRRTNIAGEIVLSGEWPFATVAQRFSWMAGRVTTRPEDLAYCLLGIFDVSMPMLYGEGERAFVRLQEEIIKDSDDQSVFAWDASGAAEGVQGVGALARHPGQFRDSAGVECLPDRTGPYALTNKGLQITLPIIELAEEPGRKIALLSCSDARDVSSRIGIRVQPDGLRSATYRRLPGSPVVIPTRDHDVWNNSMRSIYLAKHDQTGKAGDRPLKCHIRGPTGPLTGVQFVEAWPQSSWHVSKTGTMTMLVPTVNVGGGGGATSKLLFKLPDSGDTFCLVLTILPSERTATMGLVLGPHKPSAGGSHDFMLGVSKSATSSAPSRNTRLGMADGRSVSAQIVPGGEEHVIGVILSRS